MKARTLLTTVVIILVVAGLLMFYVRQEAVRTTHLQLTNIRVEGPVSSSPNLLKRTHVTFGVVTEKLRKTFVTVSLPALCAGKNIVLTERATLTADGSTSKSFFAPHEEPFVNGSAKCSLAFTSSSKVMQSVRDGRSLTVVVPVESDCGHYQYTLFLAPVETTPVHHSELPSR